MELRKIVSILDQEFEVGDIEEDWSEMFDELFLEKSLDSFRKPSHNVGLMITNSDEVNKIYTAFSPSRYILEEIRMRGVVNSLLIVKNPFDWDGRRNGPGFIHFSERDYQLMEGMGISIYSLHTPLDKNRNDAVISSAHAFAKVIKMKVEEEFACSVNNPKIRTGLIGKVQEKSLAAFVKRINSQLDYRVKVRKVSDEVGKVAIVTGSNFNVAFIKEAQERGASTYITGATTPNSSYKDKVGYAKVLSETNKLGMNILGGSCYLTEKWTMKLSIPYFSKIYKSEFIEDKEALNLLE